MIDDAPTDKLGEYISRELRKGFTINEIRDKLLKTGYDEATVYDHLKVDKPHPDRKRCYLARFSDV